MSQRNPLNERYTSDEARTGKTRKSAASAKPTTKAAASVRVQGKVEEPKGLFARATKQANKSAAAKNSRSKTATKADAERRKEQAMRQMYYNPDTAEYKKWRKIWWVMLGSAILLTVASFWLSGQEGMTNASFVTVGLSYLTLIFAIIIEMVILRRLRREYQDVMIAQENSKKNSAKRKEAAAEARRAAKEAEKNPQPVEEKRKPFRGLFTRKRATDAVATAKDAQARAEAAAEDAASSKDAAKAAGAAK